MNQLKHRSYAGSQLNPAPIGHTHRQGVAYATDGYKFKQNPTEWDYLYNRPRSQVPVLGHGVPLAYEETKTNLPDQSMFIFQNNISHPNCCPSKYSTSTGCVCTNSDQRRQISYTRAGNNSTPTYPFI